MHGYPSPSKLDQYRKLKEKALQGKLGAEKDGNCVYSRGARNCGVGALFTQAQIKDIKARDLNDAGVHMLAESIGKKNLEAVTGFTLEELSRIQGAHDTSLPWLRTNPQSSAFVEWMDVQIAHEKAKLKA